MASVLNSFKRLPTVPFVTPTDEPASVDDGTTRRWSAGSCITAVSSPADREVDRKHADDHR